MADCSSDLTFSEVTINDLDRIYEYTSIYGEGSCQHSPVGMYSLFEKYGDCVCISDGFMYTLRRRLCDDSYRIYLAPMGEGDLKSAYDRILKDASRYGRKAKFITLTKPQVDFLQQAYPDRFEYYNDRNLAEYIFSAQTMRDFPGKVHARRRTEIRSFWRDYGERTTVSLITNNDLKEVIEFAYKWLRDNSETHDEDALNREMIGIRKQITNYDKLGISGTVIRVDGNVRAFCYGIPLNKDYYDVLIEKGDREFPGIYRVLRQESTKLNVTGEKYINFEEDVGVEGLRRLKESYCPEFMIEKYVVTQL